MHSPVWQDNHPSYDMVEIWSDWEYYSDDYYDQESQPNGKKPSEDSDKAGLTGRKRRKGSRDELRNRKRGNLMKMTGISKLSLGDPIGSDASEGRSPPSVVKWREESSGPKVHLVDDCETDRVALLQDWRERFGVSPENTLGLGTLTSVLPFPILGNLAVPIESKSKQHRRPKQESPPASSTSWHYLSRGKKPLKGSGTASDATRWNERPTANGQISTDSASTRIVGTNGGKRSTDHQDGQRTDASHSSATTKLREFAADLSHQAKVPSRKRKTQEDEPMPKPDSGSVQTKPCFVKGAGGAAVTPSPPVTRQRKRFKRE